LIKKALQDDSVMMPEEMEFVAPGGATLPKPVSENLEKRKNGFMNDCAAYVPAYGKTMIREFFDYRTEKNKSVPKCGFSFKRPGDVPHGS
jgi:hypothetical protein